MGKPTFHGHFCVVPHMRCTTQEQNSVKRLQEWFQPCGQRKEKLLLKLSLIVCSILIIDRNIIIYKICTSHSRKYISHYWKCTALVQYIDAFISIFGHQAFLSSYTIFLGNDTKKSIRTIPNQLFYHTLTAFKRCDIDVFSWRAEPLGLLSRRNL